MDQTAQTNKNVTVVVPTKSVGVSLILTFLFGPLGMLYSTILGAIIMFFVDIIVGFLTFGFGLLFTWPICMIWGAVATHNYNKRIMSK
jgi:hypothetical protein